MTRFLLTLAAAAALAVAQPSAPRTMRLDYVHSGSASGETLALESISLEGAWPGPLDRWIDETNLGKYYFQVIDRATNRLIYSRGFASVYGEWEIAAVASYEFVEIVVSDRKYGGGGIFNLYATVAADNAFTPYIFVHEFGHHFAGLADEYYTSDVAFGSSTERPEPWEPNATADPQAAKWKELLSAGIGLPTPWPKIEFEKMEQDTQARRRAIRAEHRPEEEMEALFREERQRETAMLASGPNAGKVGAFEGALYEARGYYRPAANSRKAAAVGASARGAMDI